MFVLGGPGAGKTTLCAALAEATRYATIAPSELLRAERFKKGSDLGKVIDGYLKRGQYVPVEITVGLVKSAMADAERASGARQFVIDGFPARPDNVDGWFAAVGETAARVVCALYLDCPEATSQARLLARGRARVRTDPPGRPSRDPVFCKTKNACD